MDDLQAIMESAEVEVKDPAVKAAEKEQLDSMQMTDIGTAITALMNANNASALEKMARLKKAASIIEQMEKKLIPAANVEFKAAPGGKVKLMNGDAVAKNYTQRGTWTYSAMLMMEETQLKKKQKVEQANGTATKIYKPLGPSDRVFSITLI